MKNKISITLAAIIGLAVAIPVLAGSVKVPQRLDFINIGDPASETNYNLQGWGPIEPTQNGGNWGQIGNDISGADCDLPTGEACDHSARVVYSGNNLTELDHPTIDGRMASFAFTLKNKWGLITNLKMRVLDGIANDDFVVYVKNKKNGNWEQVFTYISDPSTSEVWKVHNISLGPKNWFSKPLEVAIMATGDTWPQHATYGQLGIDWIELVGVGTKSDKDED